MMISPVIDLAMAWMLAGNTVTTPATPSASIHQQPVKLEPASKASDEIDPQLTLGQRLRLDAHTRYQRELERSLRNSASPRDWAISAVLVHYDDPTSVGASSPSRAALLRKAAAAAPNDRLVQWLWASQSASDSGCDTGHPCPGRSMALAHIEPDNGAAWVPAIGEAAAAGDAGRIDRTLAKMAAANRFDEMLNDSMTALLDVARRYPPPFDQNERVDGKSVTTEMARLSFVFAQATAITIPNYRHLVIACRRDKHPEATLAHFENCGKIGRLMLTRSGAWVSRLIACSLLRESGIAGTTDVENARTALWQYEQYGKLIKQEQAGQASLESLREQVGGMSEVEANQRALRHANFAPMPPTGWRPTREGKPVDLLGSPFPTPVDKPAGHANAP